MNSGTVTGSSSRRHVTAFFRRRADAEEVVSRLATAGIARDRIRLLAGDGKRSQQPAGGTSPLPFPEASARLWASLRHLFLPWAKQDTTIQGPQRDGCLVSVSASDADHELVVAILGVKGVIKAAKHGKVAVFPAKNP
jgi:Flp pilus assembly CpaE family ATPase